MAPYTDSESGKGAWVFVVFFFIGQFVTLASIVFAIVWLFNHLSITIR